MRQWFKKNKTLLMAGLGTLAGILILTLLMDQIIMPVYTKHGRESELPDVTERPYEEARKYLEDIGFNVVREAAPKFDANYPEGTVLYQNPPPYSRVKKGRRVYLTLSAGVRRVEVPRVVGASERDAEFKLRQSGLILGDVFYDYSNYYPNGVVSAQGVNTGDTLTEKSPVDITVSIGALPSKFVVPDVLEKSLDAAEKMIKKAGLTVGKVESLETQQYIPETVLKQSLNPGEEVSRSTPVDLVVSKLPEVNPWSEQ